MKTRVIQDEPDRANGGGVLRAAAQPREAGDEPPGARRSLERQASQGRDLRLARLRRRRVPGREHGRRESAHRPRPVHRRVARRRAGARRRRPAADRGGRAAAERHAHRSTTPSSRRRPRTSPPDSAKIQYVEDLQSPLDGRRRGDRRRPRRARQLHDRRRLDRGQGPGRPHPRRDRRRPGRPPRDGDRAVRRRERREGDQRDDHRRHRQGGDALAADHADHPHDHLRLAGRRGRAAADRAHLGARGARPGRDPQPGAAARRQRQRRDPDDRPRGRGRLLALLPAPRARGARRRARRGLRARGRRRDLGPRRADLRPHRDGRDGRDVHQRRQGVHLLRLRDDDRGRDRDVRLADRASGDALLARRPGREGPDPVPRPAPAPREASRASGPRSSIASPGVRGSRSSLAGGALVALCDPGPAA